MNRSLRVLTLAAAIATAGCSFRYPKEPNGGPAEPDALSGTVSYTHVRSRILGPSCLGCHASREPVLLSYADVLQHKDAIREAVLVKGSMPPRHPLRPKQRRLLAAWLADGAPEHLPDEPVPGKVTWTAVREQVIEASCAECHGPENPDGLTDLTGMQAVKDSIGTILYITLASSQMPPPPAALSVEQKKLLADWVIDGMQE